MRSAEAPLEKIARTPLILPRDEQIKLATRLIERTPEAKADFLQREDVQEAMRGAEAVLRGEERGLSMDEFCAEVKRLKASFLLERVERVTSSGSPRGLMARGAALS